jgi:cytochrome c-type biogenesis protein CcmF
MPWLVGTALVHSLAVTDKRGLFKSWTLLLAILAFSLSLLGTFLVRSGVLTSVHSFAADPTRGVAILAFLVVVVGGALLLYAWRAPMLRSQAGFELGARESFLLFNNILLVVAAGTVFLGTLAPLIADALGLGVISVGPPYFNPTFLMSTLPLVALLGIGIHAAWKRGRLGTRRRALLASACAALVVAVVLAFGLYGGVTALAIVGFTLGGWIIATSLVDPVDRLRRRLTLPRAVLGMTIAHTGVGVFVIAITAVEVYTHEKDASLAIGERARVGSYEFALTALEPAEGPNYAAVRGTIEVSRDGRVLAVLHPEKRRYWVQGSVMTEAGIATRGGSDLFAALGEDLGQGRWSVRTQVRPLINYVWLGALIMALGGALAASDRRYRLARAAAADTAPATASRPLEQAS